MYSEFQGGEGPWAGRDGMVADLSDTQQRILSAVRRLALIQPIGAARCQAVHIALQRDFGEVGMGIEHLLRCWLVGLSRQAARRVVLGEPACPIVLPDEVQLLRVMDLAEARPVQARDALASIAGTPCASALLPLFAGVAEMTRH